MASPTTGSDPQLQALQEKWAPEWNIWRARRTGDPPGVATGEYVATRMQRTAGRDPTIMLPTAQEMDKALHRQKDLADHAW